MPPRTALPRMMLMSAVVLMLTACAGVRGPTPAPGGSTASSGGGNVWSKDMEAKRIALEAATADSGIAVVRTRNNELQANVPSDFSFDVDSATLKARMKVVLDQFAADLELPALLNLRILVVGHTDSTGPDAVNDALSLARAATVARYLESKGIAGSRIRVEGRGEREPLMGNEMPITRALNRRVEMILNEPAP